MTGAPVGHGQLRGRPHVAWRTLAPEHQRQRPLYARLLGLRFVNPGAALCFVFFEGSVLLAALLALAELVTWWSMIVLPVTVAVMVKLNDLVAGEVIRSAAWVPDQERDRFRRRLPPGLERSVGRARVPAALPAAPRRPESNPAGALRHGATGRPPALAVGSKSRTSAEQRARQSARRRYE